MTSIHTGHRQRLRSRCAAEGLGGFQPHEVVELLLFFAIPRRDTNPIAHALIDKFGSVSGVLSASKAQLMRVDGVGAHAAEWLLSVGPAMEGYLSLTHADRAHLGTRRKAEQFAKDFLSGERGAKSYLILLDSGGCLLYVDAFAAGSRWGEADAQTAILSLALRYSAFSVVLVSSRRCAKPTPYDLKKTRALCDKLGALSIILLDHLLVAPGDTHSMYYDDVCAATTQASARVGEITVQDTWFSDSD